MSDNDYYKRTKEFDPRTRANGLDVEFELDAISAAFDKIPAPREDGQGYDGPIHVGEATAPTHAVQLQQMEAKLGDNTENANRAEEAAERAEEARDIAIEKARQSGEARDEALEAAATVTNIHREQLEKALGVNARVYPRLTNQNLKVGDVIPAPEDTADGLPITHVIVDGNAYAMSPIASGLVSNLSETSATIGGAEVAFLISPDSNKRQVSLASWFFNPPQSKPTYDQAVDWSDTINSADAYCAENGLSLFWPDGQYCIKKNINWSARWVTNSAAPELAPFPQLDDDKRFLRDGYKHLLTGVSIFAMTGAYTEIATQRSDMFATMKPVVKTGERYAVTLSGGMAIVQDMDVLDAVGGLTLPATDNRSSGFDVGFLVDDASACDFPNLVVFGYFDKAGTCIWSHGAGDNPDYTKFGFGSTSGYYGLALIANDSAAGTGPGLSGTQCYGFQLFGNDHHSRQPQPLQAWQTNAYGHLLFIDGDTAAASADANGHEFIGGGWRTYSKDPVILDHCSNLHLVNVPFEFSVVSGQPDTGSQKFKATSNTRNVVISASRNNSPSLWAHADFGGVIEELCIQSDNFGGTWWGNKGQYVGVIARGGGDEPRLVFTENPSSSEQGFTIRRDEPTKQLHVKLGGTLIGGFTETGMKLSGQLTTAVQVGSTLDVSAKGNLIQVTSVGNISNITPVVANAEIVIVGSGNGQFTLVTTGGNIRAKEGVDRVVRNQFDYVTLRSNGVHWVVCD
ncbi:hypothetical protein CGT81_18645 [Vibrio cholerae]|uniref:hypothetical protein n=1 Tax=Vibrio cholerae TaxID=666 RepID=UPI000BA90622|nr:hypothetical protein [Vibrio cholerae]PAR92894.1 hypothetical protein CGT81_18645 [Vibrio cholerae]